MSDYQFIKSYLEDLSDFLRPNEELIEKLIKVRNLLLEVRKNNKKVLIFGNGGSASTANHFANDMTKNVKIKTFSYSNDNLITCYSNDYGFNNWIKKVIEHYGKQNDLCIFISASGNSENVVRAVKYCKKNDINFIGIELNPNNFKLAKNRIDSVLI